MALFFILYFSLLLGIAGGYWRYIRKKRPELRFTYRITDIWAAMLVLTPSSLAVASLMRSEHLRWDAIVSVVMLILAQLVGVLIGRLRIELPPHHGARNAFESAVSIAGGGAFGILLAMGCGFAAGMIMALLFR